MSTNRYERTTLGVNIRRLRGERGWTQDQLGKYAETTSVGMIESGARADPAASTVIAIAGALGVTVADLYAAPRKRTRKSA